MKKILKYFLVMSLIFLGINNVNAESITSIDMDIYIDKNGNAHVTETWVASPTEKTEYYHAYNNIGNSTIKDFKVKDENQSYTLIDWNVDASFNSKAYKYGYNYTSKGVELCFGKSSYKKHTYTLTYTIENFITQVSDADIIYWNLLDSIKPSPGTVNIVIYSDTYFEDNLDVWGYGYKDGYAYVYDGKIYLSTEGSLGTSEYMVALVKFPKGTFNTSSIVSNKDFNYYYELAEQGATHHKDNDWIFFLLSLAFQVVIWFVIIFAICAGSKTNSANQKYKLVLTAEDKKMKDIPNFRDIPCNKDIFRAYYIAYNYGLMKKQTDLLGAVLLKWMKDDIAVINKKEAGGIFKKEETTITLNNNCNFENKYESDIYSMLYEASKDGILESKEFEKWAKKHYSKILNWFNKALDNEAEKFIEQGKLIKNNKKVLFFHYDEYTPSEELKEEAKQVQGLKKFLVDFTNIKNREAIEVKLYDEYLMFASIFGIADKVAKQFKELYPEYIENYNFDYNDIVFINSFSTSGVNAASVARSRAQSYSSGGGGFSSSGGGGGSFGGGGGGSR